MKLSCTRNKTASNILCKNVYVYRTEEIQLYFVNNRMNNSTDVPVATMHLGAKMNPNDIEEGDDVYFECEVDANPPAYKVVWEHNVSIRIMVSLFSAVLHFHLGLDQLIRFLFHKTCRLFFLNRLCIDLLLLTCCILYKLKYRNTL